MRKEKIEVLMKRCVDYFKDKCYTENRISKYESLWRTGIVRYMASLGEEYYSSEIGHTYMETCNYHGTVRLQEREHIRSVQVLDDMARKISPELISERLSCYSMRHSRAMHLLQVGVNLVYIREILGHLSIQTTDIYARADSKAKREALEKAHTDLTPNKDSECTWERNKDLREWLKGLNH